MTYDAIIIGGGPAGLEAALMLGRACRRVLLCDAGAPRNRSAAHSHGLLTRDGLPPLELVRLGRADLARYETVELRDVAVTGAAHDDGGGFVVTLAGGEEVRARGVIVAAGMRDLVPEGRGFRELWGTGVFHCPYCHGWELRGEPLAVYGQDLYATHMVYVLKAWTRDVALVTDGPAQLDAAQRDKLARNDIAVHEGVIAALEGDEAGLQRIRFEDGSVIARRGLLFHAPSRPSSEVPAQLGAAFLEDGRPVVDLTGQTTVPRLYVAGDVVNQAPTIMGAAATGAMAGAGLSNALALADADDA